MTLLLVSSAFAQTRIEKTSSVEAVGYTTYSATAYCLKGKMANGKSVHPGAIAVDKRLIPLGTTLEILGLGTFTASDLGGGIKGKRLDLWFSSCSKAVQFGRRQVQVKVIKPRKVMI